MPRFKSVRALEVFDSRGNPTVQTHVTLSDGSQGSAIVPSGASVGAQEAVELRDNEEGRFHGKGVSTAVTNVNDTIGAHLLGSTTDPYNQREVDQLLLDLDNSPNKAVLGANALLSVSLSTARAVAASKQVELFEHIHSLSSSGPRLSLPVPMLNVLNGGAHANNNVDIQEFMIVPAGFERFSEAMRCAAEVFQALKIELGERNLSTAVGDEGGFAPDLASNAAAIELLDRAVARTAWQLGKHVYYAVDCAATEFCRDSNYVLAGENRSLNTAEWIGYLEELVDANPFILSIEDGIAEGDYDGWSALNQRLGDRLQSVGDDVFCTNASILSRGIVDDLANSILVKVNQIGTLTEALDVIDQAKRANWTTVVSHRSGDTEDTTIADIAVGYGAGQIKTGSMSRSERIAKYNRLLNIEASFSTIPFAGTNAFASLDTK